jgi:membrane associated rhomboid family serine protease
LLPITAIQVLFGKKEVSDLFAPIKEIFTFVFEPRFTISMIIINIIIFIVALFASNSILDLLIMRPSDLLQLRLWTLITAGFLHANLTHLFGNMIALFIFGRVVEKELGSGKTALIYFGALIISSLFSSLIHLFWLGNNTAGIGASGALMGLIATAILLKPFYLTYELIFPLPIMVVGWLAILADITGVLNPIEDGIGHFAHIGGFISIAILCFLLGIDEKEKLKKGLYINIASLVAAGFLLYYLGII